MQELFELSFSRKRVLAAGKWSTKMPNTFAPKTKNLTIADEILYLNHYN